MGKTDRRPIADAAQLVGVHRNTLSRWVKAGKLPAIREIRGNVVATLVSVSDVRKLVGTGIKAGRPPLLDKSRRKLKG